MFLVSTPALVVAACREGLLGSFPAHGTRGREVFEQWLIEIDASRRRFVDLGERPAPFAVNLVVHATNARYQGDLELCVKHRVPVVLSSKSAPGEVVARVHDYGGLVFHDIASQRHAEKALEAGVDGLIAVCGGAGGHTGTINPFALLNEVRGLFDGPVVLAGGMTTGRDVLAAQAMGADFAYLGTRFIATTECRASDGFTGPPQGHGQDHFALLGADHLHRGDKHQRSENRLLVKSRAIGRNERQNRRAEARYRQIEPKDGTFLFWGCL
jgi:nitronate monooxygenase